MNKRPLAEMATFSIVAVSLMIVVLAAFGAQGANGQASTNPAASPSQRAGAATQSATDAHGRDARATTTSKPAAYPSAELVEACEQEAKTLKGKLDDTFSVTVTAPFVVAGNMPLAQMQKYISGCITAPAQAMWNCYFARKPDHVITVLLFADAKSYGNWADSLFGDKVMSPFGYYRPDKRTLVMNIGLGGGTLVHELTHALIVYDFPSVPLWFNEGLACLHEQSGISGERIVGRVNWRLPALEKAIADGKLRPLADMISKNDFYDEKTRGLNYAQSRYFFMYMQEKDLIQKLYKIMRDNHKETEGDVKLVEQAFGKKIGEIEADYLAWLKTVK
jgi:hypothetical protein